MLWNRALHFLSGFLKAKAIKGPSGEPYLERYMLFRWGGHAVFLHRFLASDPDRGLHDHPWSNSMSFILCGSYLEKRLVSVGGNAWMKIRRLKAGMVNKIRGDDFHQVVLEPGVPAWTIFYHGPRVKSWGFAVGDRSKSMEDGAYSSSSYEAMQDSNPEAPWELDAPRGRFLPSRMAADHCLRER